MIQGIQMMALKLNRAVNATSNLNVPLLERRNLGLISAALSVLFGEGARGR